MALICDKRSHRHSERATASRFAWYFSSFWRGDDLPCSNCNNKMRSGPGAVAIVASAWFFLSIFVTVGTWNGMRVFRESPFLANLISKGDEGGSLSHVALAIVNDLAPTFLGVVFGAYMLSRFSMWLALLPLVVIVALLSG